MKWQNFDFRSRSKRSCGHGCSSHGLTLPALSSSGLLINEDNKDASEKPLKDQILHQNIRKFRPPVTKERNHRQWQNTPVIHTVKAKLPSESIFKYGTLRISEEQFPVHGERKTSLLHRSETLDRRRRSTNSSPCLLLRSQFT
jgi:hypothetical protein